MPGARAVLARTGNRAVPPLEPQAEDSCIGGRLLEARAHPEGGRPHAASGAVGAHPQVAIQDVCAPDLVHDLVALPALQDRCTMFSLEASECMRGSLLAEQGILQCKT